MNNTMFAAIVLLVMGGLGGGAYFAMESGVLQAFDFKTASAEQKHAYLGKKSRAMKNAFKPNYLSKGGQAKVSGSAIQISYNTGMGSVACGTEVDCDVKQCKRYLGKAVSRHNIPVKLVYTDMNGRRVGSQTLQTSACQAKIKRWDAGAERRKAKKARDRKKACSDDYVGMPPLGC